jgi:prevent-host-death family protein
MCFELPNGNSARFNLVGKSSMPTYNLTDAKAKLSEVLNEVLASEERIITKMGKPIARIALPLHHRDPFDRLLVTLVSNDPELKRYGLGCVW